MTSASGPFDKFARPRPRRSLNPTAAEFVPSSANEPHHSDSESERYERADDASSHSSRNSDLHNYLGSAFEESSVSDSGYSAYDNCYDEHALEEGLLLRDPPNSINTEYANDADCFHGPSGLESQYHVHPQVIVAGDLDQKLHPCRHGNKSIWRPLDHPNETGSRTSKVEKQCSIRGVVIPQTGIDDVSWESEFQSYLESRSELTTPWERDFEELALGIHQITDEIESIARHRAEYDAEIQHLLDSRQTMDEFQTERLYELTDRFWRLVPDVEEYKSLLEGDGRGRPLNWQINAQLAALCDAIHRLRDEQQRMGQRHTRSSRAFENATRELRDVVDDVSLAMDITRMRPTVDYDVTEEITSHLENSTLDDVYEIDRDVRSKSV